MFALSRLSRWAAVGGLVILGGYSLPARADELAENRGRLGPHEAILTEVGNKRLIAFYEPDGVELRPQCRDVGPRRRKRREAGPRPRQA